MKTRFFAVLCVSVFLQINCVFAQVDPPGGGCDCAVDEINACPGEPDPYCSVDSNGAPCCQFNPDYYNDNNIPVNQKSGWLISGGIALALIYIIKKQKQK